MMTIQQKAAWVHTRGIVPLPVEPGGKRCLVPGWQQKTLDYCPEWNAVDNLGVLLGERSDGLVCVDLDWPEAKLIASELLPKTDWITQREYEGVPRVSHYYYRSPGCETLRYTAPTSINGAGRIVELLSTGCYAVFAGSHHSGTQVDWKDRSPASKSPPEIDRVGLVKLIGRIAGLALVARLWVDLEGSRHDVTLALAGSWHHAGWSKAEIVQAASGLFKTVSDSETKDRLRAVASTIETAESGEAVTGLPRLVELLPPDVVDCLKKWWTLDNGGPVLTYGGTPSNDTICRDWPDLLEFESSSISPLKHKYPLSALGPIMDGAVEDLAKLQQVPIALAAQSVLSAASGAVQALYDVIIDGRRIPLSLWMILVAAAGERKTSTDTIACQQNRLRMRERMLAWELEHAGWSALNRDRGADPGPEPRQPQWLLTRGSTEGILKQLERHWPALTYTTADAGSWFKGYSMREGRETATASTLSDLWSGAFQSSVLASSSRTSNLFNRRLSLSLMLQPNIAVELFSSTLLQGQGFLSRCLPAFPSSNMGKRFYQRNVNTPALEQFYGAVDRLLAVPVPMDPVTGELSPANLLLDQDAMELWIEAHDRVEKNLQPGGEFADIRDTANKAPEQALRLAGVIAAIEQHKTVRLADIQGGIELMDHHLNEWHSLAGKLQAHKTEVALPRQLWEWMVKRRQEKGQTTFTLREIYNNGPRFLRNQSQLTRELVMELIRRGYMRLKGKDYEMRPEDAP